MNAINSTFGIAPARRRARSRNDLGRPGSALSGRRCQTGPETERASSWQSRPAQRTVMNHERTQPTRFPNSRQPTDAERAERRASAMRIAIGYLAAADASLRRSAALLLEAAARRDRREVPA
ncbi:MAG: hypothetical protein WAT39_12205 [Planctomycetota bacterium]